MTVISISGELGSEEGRIAEHVAQALGFHFADRRVIGEILRQYGFVQFGQYYDIPRGFWSHLSQEEDQRSRMVDMLNRAILALAHHGHVVIDARSSFAVLSGLSDVLSVRIEAPIGIRTKRVMEQLKLAEPEQAEAVVKESDEARTGFLQWYYGTRWDRAEAFDVVIDTGKIASEMATTWLVEAARALAARKGGDASTTESIQVDPILASTVSEQLQCQVAHAA